MNENKSTWGIIVVKSDEFVPSFFRRNWSICIKKTYRNYLTFTYRTNLWWKFRKKLWPSQDIWPLKTTTTTSILPFIWRCMWKRIWCLRRPLCRRKIRWDFWVWFWSEIIFIVIAARNRYLRIGCRVGRGGPIGLITKVACSRQTEAIMCWNK